VKGTQRLKVMDAAKYPTLYRSFSHNPKCAKVEKLLEKREVLNT
jgi:hypothetical protein